MIRRTTVTYHFGGNESNDVYWRRKIDETMNMLAGEFDHLDSVERRCVNRVLGEGFTAEQWAVVVGVVYEAIRTRERRHRLMLEDPKIDAAGRLFCGAVLGQVKVIQAEWSDTVVAVTRAITGDGLICIMADGLHEPSNTELKREAEAPKVAA